MSEKNYTLLINLNLFKTSFDLLVIRELWLMNLKNYNISLTRKQLKTY